MAKTKTNAVSPKTPRKKKTASPETDTQDTIIQDVPDVPLETEKPFSLDSIAPHPLTPIVSELERLRGITKIKDLMTFAEAAILMGEPLARVMQLHITCHLLTVKDGKSLLVTGASLKRYIQNKIKELEAREQSYYLNQQING